MPRATAAIRATRPRVEPTVAPTSANVSLHYITFDCIALYYIALHHMTISANVSLHYITLHYITTSANVSPAAAASPREMAVRSRSSSAGGAGAGAASRSHADEAAAPAEPSRRREIHLCSRTVLSSHRFAAAVSSPEGLARRVRIPVHMASHSIHDTSHHLTLR